MPPRKIQREKFIPDNDEFKLIVQTANKMAEKWDQWEKYPLMIQLCYNLGLRNSECCKININDINFKQHVLNVFATKTQRQESLYINNATFTKLTEYIANHEEKILKYDGYLFYTARNPRLHIRTQTFHRIWRIILKKSGLDDEIYIDGKGHPRQKIRIHDLRAKFCTDLLDNHSMDKVMKCSRHKDAGILIKYYDRRNKHKVQTEIMEDLGKPKEVSYEEASKTHTESIA